MVKIFIIFILAIFAVGILIAAAISLRSQKRTEDMDRQYYDEEGNHLYYDRSLIEKEEFRRAYPSQSRYIRTLRRLFGKK